MGDLPETQAGLRLALAELYTNDGDTSRALAEIALAESLDTPADLEFMIALFKKMPTGEAAWSFDVPLNIVKANPSLAAINAADNTRLPGHATA